MVLGRPYEGTDEEVICRANPVVILGSLSVAWGHAGFNDNRVMLQGFYWESRRHGYPDKFPQFGTETWYVIVEE